MDACSSTNPQASIPASSSTEARGGNSNVQEIHDIGRVSAGVAHDFNNLLMALDGSLELLLEEVADRPAAVEWGKMALRATERGKLLTDRLLSFSRQQVLVARPAAVPFLLTELQRSIGPTFQKAVNAKTELVVMPCLQDLKVLADLAHLEKALVNVAMNARDALISGGCLCISASERHADLAIVPPGYYTVITFADTGSGMDAETLAQACEPFFSTKGLNCTGLGLSMVQGFAYQSGGALHITSVLGEGTQVDLWLPSANEPPAEGALIAVPVATAQRILVVDDSPELLLVVSAFLRRAGYDVTSVLNGELALAELARGTSFQAIVTDFCMPGMNGLELLARARKVDPENRGMIVTGYSDPALMSKAGNIPVLRKPFRRAELLETVQALLAAKPTILPGI